MRQSGSSIPPLLEELLRAPGPSGHEEPAAAIVRREAAAFAGVSSDVHGTTVASVRGRAGGPLLALVAHVDQVGMAVARVRPDGLLPVHRLGAWEPAAAAGQRVVVAAGAGPRPGVVRRREGGDGPPAWSDLIVDLGAADAAAALALVAPGDPVVLDAPPLELAGGRVTSGALDNRASVYAAVEALRRLAADPPAADVALLATVREEIDHAGSRTSVVRQAPDVALVLDVTYAVDVPGGDPDRAGDQRLGSGAAIFRGPVTHPRVVELLVAAAEEEGIPYTIETGERTMTDADDVGLAGAGIATGLVSIPLRSMHTAVETVELADVEAVSRLAEAFARRLEPGLDLVR